MPREKKQTQRDPPVKSGFWIEKFSQEVERALLPLAERWGLELKKGGQFDWQQHVTLYRKGAQITLSFLYPKDQ